MIVLRSPQLLTRRRKCCGANASQKFAHVGPRLRILMRADPEDPKKNQPGVKDGVDKLIEELERMGMTSSKAKEVLKGWSNVGINDPDQLKERLRSSSLAPIPTISLQALFDAIACYGGFLAGSLLGQGGDFPFRVGVQFLAYFVGVFYFIQSVAGISVVGILLYSGYKYGRSSGDLLAAVQRMAAPQTGLSVVDKTQQAVNVLNVLSALEGVSEQLKEQYGEPPRNNSLQNLGAYMTLAQARDSLGFKPQDYGLSDREAGNIAVAFSVYDKNEDFRLEKSELGNLCSRLGKGLDEPEITEALKILDANNDGYIDFAEFVGWWVKETGKKGVGPRGEGDAPAGGGSSPTGDAKSEGERQREAAAQ